MAVKVEEEWRYKKIRSETASRSAFAFKINSQVKEKSRVKMLYGYGSILLRSREVVIKITGGAWSKKGIKNTVEYISRDYQLEIIDREGNKYDLKEEIKSVMQILQKNVIKAEGDKKLKLTHNMVFSTPQIAEASKEHILQASIKALKEKYPDNYFVAAYHDETANSHVHVVLNINKDNGERINIRKKDLRELRKGFCQNLIDYGYEVKASRKYENGKYNLERKDYEELKRENRNIYQVVEFGNASYKLDKRNNKNSYLIYKTANDKELIIWGKELLDEIQSKNITIGDFIKINKTGEVDVKVPVFDNDGKTILDWKKTKRNCWNIEKAENKIEHQLTPDREINKEIKEQITEHRREIKLDSSKQREKQLAQREKFEHEKKLELDPKYKREFEQEQKLEQEIKHKRKFSW